MRQVTIDELGILFDGPHATPTRRDKGPYFLNIASLKDGRLDLAESDHVSNEDFVRWTRRVTPESGDLLFSYETRLGSAAMMPDGIQACLGRRMALLRPHKAEVHPRYLLYRYLAPDFQDLINEKSIHGATVDRIALSTMGSWPLAVHELTEQRAIAEVLGALDDKIAANDHVVQLAEQLMVAEVSRTTEAVSLKELARQIRASTNPAVMNDLQVRHYSLPAFDASRLPVTEAAGGILSGKFMISKPSVLISKLNPRFPRVWNIPFVDAVSLASTEFVVLEPEGITTSVLWAVLAQPDLGQTLVDKASGTSGPDSCHLLGDGWVSGL